MLRFKSSVIITKISLLLVFFAVGAVFAQESFVYDSAGKPDPFNPWVTSEGRLQILKNQEKNSESELSLEGIIYDKYGLSYVVVNSEVVKIGDTVSGYQILKIEEKRVIFIKEGELKEVAIKEDGS